MVGITRSKVIGVMAFTAKLRWLFSFSPLIYTEIKHHVEAPQNRSSSWLPWVPCAIFPSRSQPPIQDNRYIMAGWWFRTWMLWLSIKLGMSSSQRTNSIIFQRGRYTTNQSWYISPIYTASRWTHKPYIYSWLNPMKSQFNPVVHCQFLLVK